MAATCGELAAAGLAAKLMIDCSHANAQRKHRAPSTSRAIWRRIAAGDDRIFGVMIESHINPGRQDLVPGQALQYGVSITDPRIGWDATADVLGTLAAAVRAAPEAHRRRAVTRDAGAGSVVPIETELKLALDPKAADAPLTHPAVAALRRGRVRTARVTSSYYDTPDSLLADAHVALRVRRHGARWIQTIKGPPEQGDGADTVLASRDEYEWRLSRPVLDIARLPKRRGASSRRR